jgi:opacity protein-like surface antigen
MGVVAMRRFLLAAVMAGTAAGAQAADMPDFLRGSIPAGPPVSNWQGFYVGGQGSYGSAVADVRPSINADLESTFIPPATTGRYPWAPVGQAKSVAAGYGAFAGYNSQWDDVVVGVEANYLHSNYRALTTSTGSNIDFSTTPPSTTATATSSALVSLTDFGSLRIRGGYVIGCFLPYLYGGIGFGSQTVDRTVSALPGPILTPLFANTKTTLVYGYSAGAGVDVMLVGGLFLRAEYEYLRVTSNIETNINSGRLGIGYKF